jgi:hypothetical protein
MQSLEKREKVWDEVDAKYQKQTFVHETSSEATRRLISDVKSLMRSNSAKNGFTAMPINVNGAENLYIWEVGARATTDSYFLLRLHFQLREFLSCIR